MKRRFFVTTVALGAVLAGCSTVESTGKKVEQAISGTPKAPKLHAAMRGLWHDHIVATRDYALAVHAGDSAAARKASDAAYANVRQIGNAVGGFYGKAAGEDTVKALDGHVAGVEALTNAAKARNATAEQKAMSDLTANANAIAKFLAGANPNWKESDLQSALLMHAGDHKQQVDAMMSNAPAAQQQELWAGMQKHMDMIADALSDGIAKQFPDKVS